MFATFSAASPARAWRYRVSNRRSWNSDQAASMPNARRMEPTINAASTKKLARLFDWFTMMDPSKIWSASPSSISTMTHDVPELPKRPRLLRSGGHYGGPYRLRQNRPFRSGRLGRSARLRDAEAPPDGFVFSCALHTRQPIAAAVTYTVGATPANTCWVARFRD